MDWLAQQAYAFVLWDLRPDTTPGNPTIVHGFVLSNASANQMRRPNRENRNQAEVVVMMCFVRSTIPLP